MIGMNPPVDAAPSADGPAFRGPRMVALAFLAFNLAIGLNYGLYGTLVNALQHEFHASRALASSGLSGLALAMGLLSPVAGQLLQRRSLRAIMMAGAALNGSGFLLLAFAPGIWFVLGVYVFFIGPGACLLGIIPASTLMSNWYVRGRGRALGIVTTPIMIFITPVLSAYILSSYNLRFLFLSISTIYGVLIPLLLLVVDRPEDIGQRALGAEERGGPNPQAPHAPSDDRALSSRQIFSVPGFWLLTLAIGLLTSGAGMIGTHLVPLAMDFGFGLGPASMLMSIYGFASAVSTLLFGWLVDRIGPSRSIMLCGFLQIAPWFVLLIGVSDYAMLAITFAVLGLLLGCTIVLHAAALGHLVGRATFSRAMGNSYFLKIPFNFLPAPFAGYIFDLTGRYTLAIALHLLFATLVGLLYSRLGAVRFVRVS